MLTAEDIQSMAKRGEGYNVDFKISVPSKVKELSAEVCAFANSGGGYVLIGIDNNNRLIGATINNNKRSAIQNAIRDISPVVKVKMYGVEVEEKTIWVLEIPSGKDKPYVTSGSIYVREGANSQKLTSAEEIRSLFQYNNRIYFDAVACRRFNIKEEIDEGNFRKFIQLSSISGNVPIIQILSNLQTIDENGIINNAGVLFFGKQPEKYFPQTIVRCVRFKGKNKVHIIDDKKYGGPLYQQYLQAENWVKDKMEVSYIIEGSGPRKEKWEIPLTVFKEAILNALSHRDYNEQGAVTMIEVYDDRVEVSNPGGLLPGVKKEFGRKSMTRNPLVFGLFTRMDLVEQVGSGIPRMREEMEEAGLPSPMFSMEGGFFTVTFRRLQEEEVSDGIVNGEDGIVNGEDGVVNGEDGVVNGEDGIVKEEDGIVNGEDGIVKEEDGIVNGEDGVVKEEDTIKQMVYKLIIEKEGLSTPEIAKIIDRSRRTTMRYLNLLKKEGKIEFRGAPKIGGYYIK
jgi:ATP-dependent DNA helicase RecG